MQTIFRNPLVDPFLSLSMTTCVECLATKLGSWILTKTLNSRFFISSLIASKKRAWFFKSKAL
ncbi:hypothetical protein, partial [Helicobacter pylori]|uniref:hypothetical protein n=1 Tax=Helicobacter pylori TaxID=210 RepID=UPI003133CB10